MDRFWLVGESNMYDEYMVSHKQVMEEIKVERMTYAWTAEQQLEKEFLLRSLHEKARNIRECARLNNKIIK